MKDTENMDALRKEYLTALRELAGLAVDRASHLPYDTGMNFLRSPQDADESNQIAAKITRQIADVCNKSRAIEQRSKGSIGIPALFGKDVPNVIRSALAILVGKSLMGVWNVECRSVANLLTPAGGADPLELMAVREAFRKDGLLRQYIHCEPARTIDEMTNVTLTEVAFRKLLALEPDYECEQLLNARALVAVSGKTDVTTRRVR